MYCLSLAGLPLKCFLHLTLLHHQKWSVTSLLHLATLQLQDILNSDQKNMMWCFVQVSGKEVFIVHLESLSKPPTGRSSTCL